MKHASNTKSNLTEKDSSKVEALGLPLHELVLSIGEGLEQQDELKRRLRTLFFNYHPDRNVDNLEAQALFKLYDRISPYISDETLFSRELGTIKATNGDWVRQYTDEIDKTLEAKKTLVDRKSTFLEQIQVVARDSILLNLSNCQFKMVDPYRYSRLVQQGQVLSDQRESQATYTELEAKEERALDEIRQPLIRDAIEELQIDIAVKMFRSRFPKEAARYKEAIPKSKLAKFKPKPSEIDLPKSKLKEIDSIARRELRKHDLESESNIKEIEQEEKYSDFSSLKQRVFAEANQLLSDSQGNLSIKTAEGELIKLIYTKLLGCIQYENDAYLVSMFEENGCKVDDHQKITLIPNYKIKPTKNLELSFNDMPIKDFLKNVSKLRMIIPEIKAVEWFKESAANYLLFALNSPPGRAPFVSSLGQVVEFKRF